MEIVKENIHIGLTASEAELLLDSSKTPLCLCIGNVVVAGRIRHSGSIVPTALVDAELLTQPVSAAHPNLPKILELGEGLALLASARTRWDGPRLPQKDQVLTLADEIKRLYPNFTTPMW